MKFTIANRVALASAFLCLVIASLSAFAVVRFTGLRAISRWIVADSIPGLVHAQAIDHLQGQNYSFVLKYVTSRTAEERRQIKEQMAANTKINQAEIAAYEATIFDDEDRRFFDTLKTRRSEYIKVRNELLAVADANTAQARTMFDGAFQTRYDAYLESVQVVLKHNAETAAQRGAILDAQVRTNLVVLTSVGVIAVVLGIGAAVLISFGVNRVLSRIAHALQQGAEQVTSAAAQVSGSSQTLAAGANQHAASIEETSSALEEVASMSKRNSENAGKAKALSSEATQAVNAGSQTVTQMQEAIGAINASANQVAKIITTIDEIAFQTNILALNAAVEAARAGEAGAGFAVVADEVRNLARRAAEAARETAAKIGEATQRSARGVELSGGVSGALTKILEKTAGVDALVSEIDAASGEQTRGLEQVNVALVQMNKVTQENAASAEESASAAEELNAQAMAQMEAVRELRALASQTRSNRPDETTSTSAFVTGATEVGFSRDGSPQWQRAHRVDGANGHRDTGSARLRQDTRRR